MAVCTTHMATHSRYFSRKRCEAKECQFLLHPSPVAAARVEGGGRMTQPAHHGKSCASISPARSNSSLASLTDSSADCDTEIGAVLRESIGERNFEHWFGQTARTSVDGEKLTIYVPNPFIANWLLKRF